MNAAAHPPLVFLEAVHKWAGEHANRIDILRGVSMAVEPGEFLAIMGASGSGKSTLLNLLGLLDVPSAGSLRLWGQETSRLTDDQLAPLRARSIGFIFQSFNLLPYLTALENIELGMLYADHTRRRERSRV